jgi:hypothetical protein
MFKLDSTPRESTRYMTIARCQKLNPWVPEGPSQTVSHISLEFTYTVNHHFVFSLPSYRRRVYVQFYSLNLSFVTVRESKPGSWRLG